MARTSSDSVISDPSLRDNCYDVSGENHFFAVTVIDYKNPLTDRLSAKNDNINLERSMKSRGYLFTAATGYITRENFKNELLTKLNQLTADTTSFVMSLSCHGDGDRLVFSDGKSREFT